MNTPCPGPRTSARLHSRVSLWKSPAWCLLLLALVCLPLVRHSPEAPTGVGGSVHQSRTLLPKDWEPRLGASDMAERPGVRGPGGAEGRALFDMRIGFPGRALMQERKAHLRVSLPAGLELEVGFHGPRVSRHPKSTSAKGPTEAPGDCVATAPETGPTLTIRLSRSGKLRIR